MTTRVLMIIVLFLIQCATAQDYGRIERLAEVFLEQTKAPGLSIAISKGGEVNYAKAFGFADVKKAKPMDPTVRLRTASVAKVITATALGRLATEGKLSFDDVVGMHVPYINPQYKDLTIRQLAGHTSGLTHRPSEKGYKNRQFDLMKETLPFIAAPLLFEPGTDYQYSTNAFNLLGAVIEEVSGLSYQAYMRRYIFEPLQMTQTFAENIQKQSPENAQLYYIKKGKLLKEKLTNGSYKLPGAGFRSTPKDLVKLTNAYTNGMISKEVTAEMFKSNVLTNGESTNVGITWRSSMDVFGNQAIEHAGSWRGTRTVLVYYPQEELAISVMINADCQVLIEETAHIFAQLYRTTEPILTAADINQNLIITYNGKAGAESFQGSLQMQESEGELKTNADNFLAQNKLIKIDAEAYAMATEFGLLYLKLKTNGNRINEGKVYAYTNRNDVNPKEKKPLVVFSEID
ncbi:serine hydrolase domain-containing protein [uncultured Croceitalea sp.]|uniref:serine hydrolase domain-containing protein n=1 Tax=uncultured Croceitalea sp. TaxID=1798908 RepID=UPI0033061F3D